MMDLLKEKRKTWAAITEEEASLKKPREENHDNSMGLETDDVFSQGLKLPEFVKYYLSVCKT